MIAILNNRYIINNNVLYKRVAYIRESRTAKPHQNRDFLTLVKPTNS
jgi:hypothetical protein